VSDSPTDYLTKTSTGDKTNNKKDGPSGRIVLSSSTIKFSVVKKSSEGKTQGKEEENKVDVTSTGLQSLWQQYNSSDEK
ncbi:hypothetical protein Tco_0635741, partial [Tanacetum coccineum]